MARQLSTAQYRSALQQARERHDLRYEIDYPKPQPKQASEFTGIEKAIGYLWVVWAILGLAGALISLPHTLNSVLGTVDLSPLLAIGYSIAVFVGVELALIAVALVSALKQQEQQRDAQKQASLAGLLNSLVSRIGLRPVFNLEHLPKKQAPTGAILVSLLFVAALTFNQVDALRDQTLLQDYGEEILLVSRLMVGALGPGLLLIAGHRFAHEVVRSATRRQRLERAYEQQLQTWQDGLNTSWQDTGDQWVEAVVAGKLGRAHWYDELSEGDFEEPQAVPFGTNGNGKMRQPQDY